MTRAGMAFVRGDLAEAFCIQPAGAFFCFVLAVIGVFSLLIALFGIKFRFLGSPISGRIVIIIAAAVVVVFLCGWAVTLARALAERNSF